ncbi:sensor histidine kinase [Marivirga arenosa]|uniref:histidine kinase n=1 Tax=Marivirga arenosa TaxID=3059076 RepID=A0AA49GEE0_9BACT|nr:MULTISPECIES: ATP-binding protein [unclassified Marivirga]WKK81655.1 ATP-binding protein [Marivirga sp. BKB1-2]WKK87590.2 ATP-binding protein [Marivirga sp. ABR2-2]
MLFNSRGVSILLAISIAIVTTAFLSLLEGVSNIALILTFILSSSSAYLLISIVLEFLFFKEINKLYEVFNKLGEKNYSFVNDMNDQKSLNPLRKINQEIFSYAANKQQEIDELKRMATYRREFLADVSHELKTPIFAAQGFVYTLLDGAVSDKKVRGKFLKKAAKSLDGLEMLVNDLLTLSHIEAGEIKMHFEEIDIYALVQDVFDQFEGKVDKKNIILQFDKDYQSPIHVIADYQRIYQVIVNLISNAIKYSDENTEIVVGFEISDKDVTVAIQDHGAGISPEHIKRIFERFYRIDKSRSKERGGTGLGLAIVKHIIEAHGSSVSVTSTLGKGSLFSFKLPVKKAPEPYVPIAEEESETD